MSVMERMGPEEFGKQCESFSRAYRALEAGLDPDPAVVVAVLATELASLISSQDDIDKSYQEFLKIFDRSVQVWKQERKDETKRAAGDNTSSNTE